MEVEKNLQNVDKKVEDERKFRSSISDVLDTPAKMAEFNLLIGQYSTKLK